MTYAEKAEALRERRFTCPKPKLLVACAWTEGEWIRYIDNKGKWIRKI